MGDSVTVGKHSWTFQKQGEKVAMWVDGERGMPMTVEAAKAFVDGLSQALESNKPITITFECKEDHPHKN